MQLFLEIYAYLNVVLRGFTITAQSLTLGGAVFLLLAAPQAENLVRDWSWRLLFGSAALLAIGEALAAVSLLAMLNGTLDLPIFQLIGADAVIVDAIAAALACAIAVLARRRALRICVALGVALLGVQVAATHAASRLDHVAPLHAAEFAHMLGAAVWIGGIPYFLIALALTRGEARRFAASRFSRMSLGAVVLLVGAGVFLAVDYLGDFSALYGTSYGVMLLAKAALLAGLLLFGGMNFLTVRRLKKDPRASVLPMRRFAEVEVGVGLTVLFCAVSLASLPPARDLTERASLAEVVERLAWRWPPLLESPDHASLSTSIAARAEEAPKAYAPSGAPPARNDEDIAWSEYNHHWAGLFVLLIGALALAERIPRLAPYARHWPLTFIALAAFIFVRADETAWPIGHLGFFESLRDPEIAQHKMLMLLIIAFGLFEWRVRLGKLKSAVAPYVFPLSVATAAAFLLTHSHGLANPKEEMLIEVTHMPLALVGVAVGWSRWLELRLPEGAARRIASFVWPAAFILAGQLLLFYREA